MTSAPIPGIRLPRYAVDCWGGGEAGGARCPVCGASADVGYECRMHRPPALAWLSCRRCDAWWDLGEIRSCSMAEVSEEAGRRARAMSEAPAQRTLEGWL